MEFSNISLKPKTAYIYASPVDWKGDPKGHIGQNDVFFFVVSGECYLRIDDTCYIVREGQLAFLPKGKMRTYTRVTENFKMYEAGFSAYLGRENLFSALNLTCGSLVVDSVAPDVTAKNFDLALRFEYNRDLSYDLSWCAGLMCIISEYVATRHKLSESERPFADVIMYMQKNTSKSISLSEVARLSFMQPTYFVKKFKDAMGVPPIEYHARLRVYEAMHLLSDGKMRIDEVARRIGINDSAYFSRFFKKHTGTSPVEYRAIFK